MTRPADPGPRCLSLGLDIGSVNAHAALLGADGKVKLACRVPIKGSPLEALKTALASIAPATQGEPVRVGATGTGRDLFGPASGACLVNEIVACALGARKLAPRARSLMEIGGHLSKFVLLDETGAIQDYSLNELCAAGSGAFFEQQAQRLGVPATELGAIAFRAAKGAAVAGRCSVFAKSDMIHLQQKGTPLEEIAYGLCLAVARNFASTVVKGRALTPPVTLIGGCAENAGLRRALREVFGVEEKDLLVPEHHGFFGAVGAALFAAAQGGAPSSLERLCRGAGKQAARGAENLAPLRPAPRQGASTEEASSPPPAGTAAFLGLDVGSVSTDLALIGEDGAVLDGVYLATRGQPLEAVQEGLARLQSRADGRVKILGVVTTGSGRHLAARYLRADAAVNEITAQFKSSVFYLPETDTIFEIGGQDSKYISLKNGALRDFAMNKICAAGTGSFLEEQAVRLGLSIIGEFSEKALQSAAPADFGSQCTVFMDTELVHAVRRGAPVQDLAAGLAYSVARNYLEKVVGNRPVGKNIVFQGGVASNEAVVSAFSNLLGRDVRVHPYNRLSGAIGAALIAREMYARKPFATSFVGLAGGGEYQLSGFECRVCSNRCQVNKIVRDGETAFFGDVCERYTSRSVGGPGRERRADLADERDRLMVERGTRAVGAPPADESVIGRLRARYGSAPAEGKEERPRVIGIPRASLYFELFPLWAAMFKSLGCEVVVSEPSSQELLTRGIKRLSTEACLPMKLAISHSLDLADKKVDHIFLPSIMDLPAPFGYPDQCSTCPYTQTMPYLIKAAVQASFLVPQIDMSAESYGIPEGLEELCAPLGVSWARLRAAYQSGKEAYLEFKESLLKRGDELTASGFEWAVVLIGKPYNLYDPFLNTNLVQHLSRMGILAIPYEFLARSGKESLDASWDSLPWRFNRDYIKVALKVREDRRLYPIVVSNFGCGPDAFTIKHLEKIFAGRPALFLEFDEHRGEAGLVTRLEAFRDEVEAHRERPAPSAPERKTRRAAAPAKNRGQAAPTPGPAARGKLYIPDFADHAFAYAGALRYAGFDAEVLPPPDNEVRRKGERFSSGRECHPYSILAGDLVQLAESLPPKGPPAIFFYPGTFIPCLMSQYGPGHRLILDQLGDVRLEVLTPDSNELYELLGLQGGVRLWRGLTAIDTLVKLACEMRPYEKSKGMVDAIHRVNCLDIARAVENGDIVGVAGACVERFSSAAIDTEAWQKRELPVVGIAGDMYTRSNTFANQNLFHKLEAAGCEVWPSPFMIDIFDFGLKTAVARSLYRRDMQGFLRMGSWLLLKEMSEQGVKKLLSRRVKRFAEPGAEPGYEEMRAVAAPYVGERAMEVISVNIAKMSDFASKGADGIINAMCFNCMVGNVSSAITGKLRREHDDIPIVNLVFGASEGASQSLRLEAFLHQVKAYAARRRAAPSAPLAVLPV